MIVHTFFCKIRLKKEQEGGHLLSTHEIKAVKVDTVVKTPKSLNQRWKQLKMSIKFT